MTMSLSGASDPLHGLLISDFTIDSLAHLLANDLDSPKVTVEVAPYNQVQRVLLDQELTVWKSAPSFVVVWTRPEAISPLFDDVLNNIPRKLDDILKDVDAFADLIRTASKQVQNVFLPTWTVPSYTRGLGLLNMRAGGPAYVLAQMNLRLSDALAESSNVFVLDASRWVSLVGRQATDPKLWLMGKIAFDTQVFKEAARDIKAAIRGLSGQAKKLIVLDLDNTLWGGEVGEVGYENLILGGHNAVGEAFVQFQHDLKALTQRGILLAIASKNVESVALEAIGKHPEMVLREKHFAGWKINWQDKAENIATLVAELKLGLESVVFIDDSPVERARVKDALPQVFVPDWPVDKMHYSRALHELTCFDSPAFTAEDSQRTALYEREKQREQALQSATNLEDWLHSLSLVAQIDLLNTSNLVRAAQLLNKTNQMNLRTRRMTEAELLDWSRQPGHRVFVVRVSDMFGDYGLTGIASLHIDGTYAEVDDYLLSCRVMGRGIEQTLLHILADSARRLGAQELVAPYALTNKNSPCFEFFDKTSGFQKLADGVTFRLDLEAEYPAPSYVQLEFAEQPTV